MLATFDAVRLPAFGGEANRGRGTDGWKIPLQPTTPPAWRVETRPIRLNSIDNGCCTSTHSAELAGQY